MHDHDLEAEAKYWGERAAFWSEVIRDTLWAVGLFSAACWLFSMLV